MHQLVDIVFLADIHTDADLRYDKQNADNKRNEAYFADIFGVEEPSLLFRKLNPVGNRFLRMGLRPCRLI